MLLLKQAIKIIGLIFSIMLTILLFALSIDKNNKTGDKVAFTLLIIGELITIISIIF